MDLSSVWVNSFELYLLRSENYKAQSPLFNLICQFLQNFISERDVNHFLSILNLPIYPQNVKETQENIINEQTFSK